MKTTIKPGPPLPKEKKRKLKIQKLKLIHQSGTTANRLIKRHKEMFKYINAPHNTNHFLIRLHTDKVATLVGEEIEDLLIPFGSIKGFSLSEDNHCNYFEKNTLNEIKEKNMLSALIV